MKDNLVIDNASSVLLPLSGTNKRRVKHEYKIEYKGRTIRCNTAAAATALMRAIAQEDRPKDDIPWNDYDFAEFTGRIKISQRRLLKALLDCKSIWMTDDELRDAVHAKGNQALAGILSGISKVALALNIEPARIYVAQTKYQSGKPRRFYRIASAFKKLAQANEWPSAEDLVAEDENDY